MQALLPTALSLFTLAAPPTIKPEEASDYVGREVVVQGTIDQVVLSVNLTTHINMGGRYPNHVFTATILKARQSLFTRVKDLEGRVAQVQGVVRLYRGKPEIMLTQPTQLRTAPGSEPAPAAPSGAQPGEPPSAAIADLRFDARGVDFSAWVGQFKNAVAQEWLLPEAALAGARGSVGYEIVVERDGAMSAARMLESSGTATLDRAVANALANARLPPLPELYPAPDVMVQVTFAYGASQP